MSSISQNRTLISSSSTLYAFQSQLLYSVACLYSFNIYVPLKTFLSFAWFWTLIKWNRILCICLWLALFIHESSILMFVAVFYFFGMLISISNTPVHLSNLQLMGIWVIYLFFWLWRQWCYGLSCTCFLWHVGKNFSRVVVLRMWSQHQISWKLVRNAKSGLPFQTSWIWSAGRGI